MSAERMTEALDKAEAALAINDVLMREPRLASALRALITEHRRLLAELDEAHARFQVQEARIQENRTVLGVTTMHDHTTAEPGSIWRITGSYRVVADPCGDVEIRTGSPFGWARTIGGKNR